MVIWKMVKRSLLIKMMAVSIVFLFLASGFTVMAYGSVPGKSFSTSGTSGNVYEMNITSFSQDSGQNNPGYVKYTLVLSNNSLINGNFVNIVNGIWPVGVAYDSSNGYLYVTNSFSDSVSVINGANNTVIGNITVGSWPSGVVYDPSNGYLYVTNYASGTVSIISTLTQVTKTYTVTFTESGLPTGTQWSVTFNGLTRSSTANSITFTGVPAGNYTWNATPIMAVGSGTRYVAQTSSGTISVPTVSSVSLYYVKQYSVTIQSTAGGSTSPSGTFWYNAGSTINITATPAPGYEFVGWETNSSITFTNSSSATTNATVNSAGTIVASFKAVPSSTTSSITSSTTSLITSSTQPSYTLEYVAAAVVVVIVILVAVLLIRRSR